MNLHETIYVYETISFVLFNMFVHYMSFDMRNNNKTLLNWTEDWNTSTWCRSHGVLWKGFYEIEQDGYINIVIWLILSMLWDMIHDIITGVRWVQSRDSGNDFRFPDFASHTGRFRLIFVCISSVVSFRLISDNYPFS